MLLVISPAKTLDFNQKATTSLFSENDFLPQAEKLVKVLKKYSAPYLMNLMGISEKLARENQERFSVWKRPFDLENAKQALLAFKGDVYLGLDAETLSENELTYAQDHLRILSGLYGVLRPLDLIQPYRLEMGTKINTPSLKDLYTFWGGKLTQSISKALAAQGDTVLINLASNEYFKSVNKKNLKASIVTPIFKDFSKGEYKQISFFAKKARGLMSRFILQNRLENPEDLKHFNAEGYFFSEKESSTNQFIFLRG